MKMLRFNGTRFSSAVNIKEDTEEKNNKAVDCSGNLKLIIE